LLTYRKEAEEIGNIQPFGKLKEDVLGKFSDAQRHDARTQDAVLDARTRDAITLTASDTTSTYKA
jgi:hypothetical protein